MISKKIIKSKPFVVTERYLQDLREAMIREELGIPVYTSHLESSLFWSGIPEKKTKKILELLKILRRDSLGHARLLTGLEKKLSKQVKK